MKKVGIGVMGAYRGTSMINYCKQADNAQVVAVCDKWIEGLEAEKKKQRDKNVAFYPDFDDKRRLLDQGYIARNSAHMKGSAVDMTLTDPEGTELDMGTCFDFFGRLAWHGADGITDEQAQNRLLLRTVMERCGFRAFEREWWHYRLIDQPFPDTNFDFPVN